jgi:hypothetical protein
MQPQDMHLWPGIPLQGCSKTTNSKITNGVLYDVLGWNRTHVWVRMQARYREKWGKKADPEEDEVEVDPEEPEEVEEVEDWAPEENEEAEEIDPINTDTPQPPAPSADVRDCVDFGTEEGDVKLTHAEAMRLLRLIHARCIHNVQGLTITDQHVTVLDLEHVHFTMRHLIVAGSRVTHGRYLHTMRPEQQRAFEMTCRCGNLQHDVGLSNIPSEPFHAVAADEPWVLDDEW